MELLYSLFCKYPRVITDSRRIESGAIFFALHGETFDGNRFAAAALDAGAVAVVVDDPTLPETLSETQREKCFLVSDTLLALQQLAAIHRRQLGIPILAITGSNGKTTTKELLGRVFSKKFRTAVTQGNLNNHIGVPLTLLAMDRSVEFGVVEMGANHCGEIAQLCEVSQPDFGLITNIGKAHLEGFGGIEGVMRGKGELLDYLVQHGGTAFYLEQSDALRAMVAGRETLRTIPYAATELSTLDEGVFVTALWNGIPIRSQLVGGYNLNNMAAAIAVGRYFEVEAKDIVEAIEGFQPDNNRSQRRVTSANTLILDAYNANPTSMRAALENFAHEVSQQPKVVVLGDMRELGKYARQEHREIVELVSQLGMDQVYLVGEHFMCAGEGVYPGFADAQALNDFFAEHPLQGRLILIKGSRGVRLETVADKL